MTYDGLLTFYPGCPHHLVSCHTWCRLKVSWISVGKAARWMDGWLEQTDIYGKYFCKVQKPENCINIIKSHKINKYVKEKGIA